MSGSSSSKSGNYFLDPKSTLNTPDLAENLNAFASSDEGSAYADQIKANQGAPIYSNPMGGWATGGPNANPSDPQGFKDAPWVQQYMDWLGGKNNEISNYQDYEALASMQPGMNQTVLTGPQSGALSTSILGAKTT